MTIGDALERATARLAEAGIDSAARDAERLLGHVLGLDRASLLARLREPFPALSLAPVLRIVEERARRRPLQHLVGMQAFWRHEFRVSPAALIPRPETEILVETALLALGEVPSPVVVDVGTGTGCIALSVAAERPDAEVHAVDLSPEALALARENADRLGLAERVRLHLGDLLAPVEALRGSVDAVLSNPPYVDAGEISGLAPEVRDHEPRSALVPPGDRYSVYARLGPQAAEWLRPNGILAVEIGEGMEARVRQLLGGAGLRVERVVPDLQRIPRVVLARTEGPRSNP